MLCIITRIVKIKQIQIHVLFLIRLVNELMRDTWHGRFGGRGGMLCMIPTIVKNKQIQKILLAGWVTEMLRSWSTPKVFQF